MTDKQQPPTVPERVWITHYADGSTSQNWLDSPRIFDPERDTQRLISIPYARVHQADEGRVGEIRQLIAQSTGPRFGYTHNLTQAVNDLLALLPQLSGGEPPSTYHCSCGAACTADEYIEHLLKGHDLGVPVSGSERRCGDCGHLKSQHEAYSDHDECLGCRGLDEPCCHFAATGAGEGDGCVSLTGATSTAHDLLRQLVSINGPCGCPSQLCSHWQAEAGIILTAALAATEATLAAELYNQDGSYTPVAQNIHDHARADAIDEAIGVARKLKRAEIRQIDDAYAPSVHGVRSVMADEIITALEALKQQST